MSNSALLINFASTVEFAKTWGRMKSNRSEEMNYEKMSRAMRYHYGCERQGRKGHLAMVKEKRLCYRYITRKRIFVGGNEDQCYRFGELFTNWRLDGLSASSHCYEHVICRGAFCLWTKEQ